VPYDKLLPSYFKEQIQTLEGDIISNKFSLFLFPRPQSPIPIPIPFPYGDRGRGREGKGMEGIFNEEEIK